jgi:hypothetical protein
MTKSAFIKLAFPILILLCSAAVQAASNSIVAVDKDGTTGQYTSLVLDAQGYPTISYYDASEGKLKVVHCFEKNCAKLNTILTPDAANNIGKYTFIALDSNGNPVISYYDAANANLKVLHCGNATCSAGNTIATVDSTGNVGQYTAVTVDANNFPVVSYYDVTNGKLKVLHCGNAACTAGNSIVKPDVASSNGVQSSIKLNQLGQPVIAYYDFTQSALKVLRCGNANCTAGNTITTVDSVGTVGGYPSLVIDTNGKPAISYLDLTNGKLKILRCGNATCSTGNTISSIGANGIVGYFSSLVLDADNKPVVSYYDQTNGKLNIVRCGNVACTSNNMMTIPDTTGQVGQYTSLKLDANNNPVVSYYDASNGDLKVLHCSTPTCNPNAVTVADAGSKVGRYSSIKLDASGKPVVSYWDGTNENLKILHCGNADCTAGNSITTPDTAGNTGWDTSLVLDVNGNPVVSLYDFTGKIMKVLHCNNANCTGVYTPAKPDILSHRHTSIALDATGKPIVASSGQEDQGLRIVHCGDANCAANNTITSPDSPAFPFNADVRGVSMALDSNGNPVVSFFRADKNQLKLLHCVDAACIGPNNIITILDPGAQAGDHRSTSVTLDASGNPVMAYQDTANQALKVLHCGNANCTAGNIITLVATGAGVGVQPSIKLDKNGHPVISYGTPNGMTVTRCGNATCSAGNISTVIDPGITGWDSSLILDTNDYPVVSYYNNVGENLKVVHCGSTTCQ